MQIPADFTASRQQYVGDWVQAPPVPAQAVMTQQTVPGSDPVLPQLREDESEEDRALIAFALRQSQQRPVLERWLQLQMRTNPALSHVCLPGAGTPEP